MSKTISDSEILSASFGVDAKNLTCVPIGLDSKEFKEASPFNESTHWADAQFFGELCNRFLQKGGIDKVTFVFAEDTSIFSSKLTQLTKLSVDEIKQNLEVDSFKKRTFPNRESITMEKLKKRTDEQRVVIVLGLVFPSTYSFGSESYRVFVPPVHYGFYMKFCERIEGEVNQIMFLYWLIERIEFVLNPLSIASRTADFDFFSEFACPSELNGALKKLAERFRVITHRKLQGLELAKAFGLGSLNQRETVGKTESIRWHGKHAQLVYLLENLRKSGFLSQGDDTVTLLEKHFVNGKDGKPYKNSAQVWRNIKDSKKGVRKKEVIDSIVDNTYKTK